MINRECLTAAGAARPTFPVRVRRDEGRVALASLPPAVGAVLEEVLLPSDWDELQGLGRIVVGESRARLYVTDHGAPQGRLVLCLRQAGAVRVEGPISPVAGMLFTRTRAAALRVSAWHRAAGRVEEALRWKAFARRLLLARWSSQRDRSVRAASGGLPGFGRRA